MREKTLTELRFFSGFYETTHGFMCEGSEEDEADIMSQEEYIDGYLRMLEDSFLMDDGNEIKFDFESLDSPKYYNYGNDRLFCYVEKIDDIKTKVLSDYKDKLIKYLDRYFTSREGFTSFIPNTLQEFLDFKEEGYNHIINGTYLEVYLTAEIGEDLRELDFTR